MKLKKDKSSKKNRWTVDVVRCLDCNAEFKAPFVDRDINRPLGDSPRFLLVAMPETCPSCHNLKSASAKEDEEDGTNDKHEKE